jgi:hypothetical protein
MDQPLARFETTTVGLVGVDGSLLLRTTNSSACGSRVGPTSGIGLPKLKASTQKTFPSRGANIALGGGYVLQKY